MDGWWVIILVPSLLYIGWGIYCIVEALEDLADVLEDFKESKPEAHASASCYCVKEDND